MAYLESKPRYEILDGLRGVAAMMVVAFHLVETYYWGQPTEHAINHGYLAVDFFFALSGFVVGYAYDDRWGRMSVTDFFKRRIVRLHPLLVAGGLFGVMMFYFTGRSDLPFVEQTAWWHLLLLYFAMLLMIPTTAIDGRGWSENFPINGPQWSLFWEYVANIVYALVLRRVPKWLLWILVLVAALFTVDLGLGLNLLGDKPENYWSSGTFIGGWLNEGWELHVALVRLSFPFLSGLLLSRCGRFITVRGGFWWCALAVVLMQAMPRIGGGNPANYWQNGLFETLCILLLFPLILAVGAGSRMTDVRSQKLCKFLGDISYPLYITHFPLILLQLSWKADHEHLPVSVHVFVGISLFALALAIAYAVLKLYDEPVREWLKEKVLRRKKNG